jgi:hypothetical protein
MFKLRIERNTALHVKRGLLLADCNRTLQLMNNLYYNSQMSVFVKICTGALELSYKDRRTAGTNLIGAQQVFKGV